LKPKNHYTQIFPEIQAIYQFKELALQEWQGGLFRESDT